jgi:uncharacterized membrane protein
MAKRMSKAEIQGVFWLAVIGLPIYLIAQLGESVGKLQITSEITKITRTLII